ncbi:Fn3-like domain-containing protein [Ruminococcus flavefaciens]|uniref:Fn3-like domain-containing protein n=2 Tax=Ruminococcus flavefaciens TaxID=1265 RepID=A0A1M7LPB4_RUMFL|nr:Fn3-like domain-containing protein [Ruminococcus flavefaciens]
MQYDKTVFFMILFCTIIDVPCVMNTEAYILTKIMKDQKNVHFQRVLPNDNSERIDEKMKNFTRHLLSMTAAAVIGGATVLNCGLPAALAAEYEAAATGKLVPVIISLSGDAVLVGEEAAKLGTDYLDTPEAEEKALSLNKISSEAEAYLRNLYPDLEIGYRYNVLMNGFSCELPEGLLDEASSCRWIEKITKSETVNVVKPELYTAADLSDLSYFGETTGYFGEGEVIAVLDSEFDVTHDMFAPIDDKENKLTKDDIIAVSDELNVKIDPDKAYISSKLPYVIDYSDDTPYEYAAPDSYHGTHVAGIAAGNTVSDDDGTELSGIAKDAQLVMMKVFKQELVDEMSGTYISTAESDAILAALEDAAKLKVNVVNLSLGSIEPDFSKVPYKDTITALNNAGIIVVAAAGNDSNNLVGQGEYFDIDTSSPDTHTIGEPSAFKESLCVASANNSFRRDPCFLIEGLDDEIPFTEGQNCTLSDYLNDGVYEYVYCGIGMPEDFEGKDVEGKIALIDRGTLSFWEKAYAAEQAGAIAMIVCDNLEDSSLVTMAMETASIPSVFISTNDGDKMKKAESGKIRLDSTLNITTPLDGGINEFSSFGPSVDLTLKPDITGIGGSVTSAAYDNKLKQLEGTSMASPYVAGCIAVFDQYLRKNGLELTGAEKASFIKNLIMNSAVLFSKGDVYESPRRQGAGLVNMKNALNDRVILTGETGLAKVELKDKITDQLSFDVDISNFTDQDVEFKEAKLVLTAENGRKLEDDPSEKLYICDASNIGVTADLSSLLKANAQESRTVTINAKISADDIKARSTIFPNGFFIEGYIVLSGAENCCDISIPVMGFYGDWAEVPIFHNGTKYLEPYELSTISGEGSFNNKSSFTGNLEALSQLLERLPAEEAEFILSDPFNLRMYFDDEYNEAIAKSPNEVVYLSPDADGMGEQINLTCTLLRSAHLSCIKIYDSDNKLISETPEDEITMPAYMFVVNVSEAEIKDYPDGTYKGTIEAYVYYDDADKKPQTYEFPIVIDKTAPTLNVKSKEENGRKLLEITSTDKNLDGIYIMGKGNGGIAGEYSEKSPKLAEMKDLNYIVNSIYMPFYGYSNPIKSDSLIINAIMGTTDAYEQNILNSYDFSDILPAYRYQSEDGSFSVTYDITDLDEYLVASMDKAYNTTEIMSEGRDTSHLKAGLWWAKNGGENDVYYNISKNQTGNIHYQSGAPEKNLSFKQNGDTITMEIYDETSSETRTGKITFTDKRNAEIVWNNGVTEKLFCANPDGFDNFSYINTQEMKAIVTAYHNAHNDNKAVSAEVTYDENGMGIVNLLDKNKSTIAKYTNFDRFENTAVAPNGKPVKFEYIKNGVYHVSQNSELSTKHYYVIFKEDGKAAVYSAEEGLEWEFTAEYGNNVITCNKGKDDEMSVNVTYDTLTSFSVKSDDGNEYHLEYDANYNANDVKIYTTSQIEKMATDYYERISGARPMIVFSSFTMDNKYMIEFSNGQLITVDPIGGKCIEKNGNEVDITVLPDIKDLFTSGLWSCKTADGLKYYSSDGNGNITAINAEDGSEESIKYNWVGTSAVELTFDNKTEKADATPISDTEITLVRPNDQTDILTYIGEKTLDKTVFYTDKKLADMAAADHSKKIGKKVKVTETVSSEDGTVAIRFDDGSEYKINRFSGKGTDENGKAVDLPQTGNNDISSAAEAVGAVILIILGTAAVFASRKFRRKEDC